MRIICFLRKYRLAGAALLLGLFGRVGLVSAQSWQRSLSSLTAPGTSGACAPTATATDAAGNVFVVGYFSGTVQFGASQLVSVSQYPDMFLAKWDATTLDWAWATRGGGGYVDVASGVAVRGHEVFVTGNFTSNTNTPLTAIIAGVSLPGAGDVDIFLARYLDQGSTYANGWAVSDGGRGGDTAGGGLALEGNSLYVTGTYDRSGAARFAGVALPVPTPSVPSDYRAFLARYPVVGPGPPGSGWAIDLESNANVTVPRRVAVSGSSVYVAGTYLNFTSSLTIAGTTFTSIPGSSASFLVKYVDAGASAQPGWALLDAGSAYALAVRGPTLYTAGAFGNSGGSGPTSQIAGTTLTSVGSTDIYLARYLDTGPGVSGAGAIRDGGPGDDFIQALTLDAEHVLATGGFGGGSAVVAGTSLTTAGGGYAAFVARYTDDGISFGPGWALASAGSNPSYTSGTAVALSGARVVAVGYAYSSTGLTFGPQTLLPASPSTQLDFLAVAATGPLPVVLTAFLATAAGPAAVRLAWTTASEANSARFEVERSSDGVGFTPIGQVAAAGSSTSPRTYDWLDATPPAGALRLYYRLRQVDLDVRAAYSPVRVVALGGASTATLVLYPNPAHGPATLLGAVPGAAVRVRDALGRLVGTATADAVGSVVLPAPGPPGVYVVGSAGQVVRWVLE